MAIAVMLLQFLLSDGDEIPDINKIFDEDPMKAMESFNVTSRNDELYHERLRDIILHAVDRKYIWFYDQIYEYIFFIYKILCL